MTNPPGHLWRDTWTALSGPLSRQSEKYLERCRFRGGLVFMAHRLLYHSTLGLRVIKKKKERCRDLRRHLNGDPVLNPTP